MTNPSQPDPSESKLPDSQSSDVQSSKMQSTDELTATAFHEAGHAVMALYLGRSIQKVTIIPAQIQTGGQRLGVCQIKKGQTRPAHDPLEQQVLILFAGMVAESHFTGDYCQRGAAGDLIAARRTLATRANSERQLERLARRWLEKTEHILADDDLASAIELIAAELVKHQTISGRAARHVFQQAVKN